MSFTFSLQPRNFDAGAQAAYQEAERHLENKQYNEAAALFQKSIDIQPHEESYYKLGLCLELAEKTDAALKAYNKCIGMNAYHGAALENAGDIYAASAQGLPAIECYGMAILANPQSSALKEKLVGILAFQTFKAIGEPLRNVILDCMKDPQIDLSYMREGWLSICETIPAFQNIYKTARFITYDDFHRNFAALSDYSGLSHEFFLTGLGRIFAADLKFERFLTHIRRYCLENRDFWQQDAGLCAFVSTLGQYTFFTEYIFALDEKEKPRITAIEKRCTDGKADLYDWLILSCYMPLMQIEGAQERMAPFRDDPLLAPLVARHITQEKTLTALRGDIESLTAIQDGVSKKVQEQYEESPYPRWDGFNKTMKPAEAGLWGKKARILIAGCGTGLEAIELAYCFPDADILAIDLSRASLAYGQMKAREYSITNITFKHADILGLGVLEPVFDLVTSSGVLHHMNDPMAGWSTIAKLVKPGGLMRIALYSHHARHAINAARRVIAAENIRPTQDAIRDFRVSAGEKIKRADFAHIANMRDYYTTSECRDLLFHVQEHQFTIPQLAQALATLGLEFSGFYLPEKVLTRYRNRFKDDQAATNLEYWDQFEQKNIDTFIGMYKFWCRKP